MADPPAFAADSMLGTLAKWMRLLGYDCFYERDITDERLLEIARAQGRVVLTRDRAVTRRLQRSVPVPFAELDDQLLAVFDAVGLDFPTEIPCTRCSVCNAPLVAIGQADLGKAEVPERVRAGYSEFYRCPNCRRVYWPGTHYDSMTRRLETLRGRLAKRGSAPGEPGTESQHAKAPRNG